MPETPKRKTLSIAMIAMNEEANLPRTLESVRWADEIIVVDSGSKDRTIEIAQSFGARTSHHPFGGHGEQKNVALDLCTCDWIFLLDADEVLTPELQLEVRHAFEEGKVILHVGGSELHEDETRLAQ